MSRAIAPGDPPTPLTNRRGFRTPLGLPAAYGSGGVRVAAEKAAHEPNRCRPTSAPMTTRTHFLYRIDMWTIDGEKVIEHLAGVEDFQVAMATYRAACERWPGTAITLRRGARVIEAPIRPRQETLASLPKGYQ